MGEKHSCGEEQELEDGYEEEAEEEVEEGKEKGWGRDVGNRRRSQGGRGTMHSGDLVPLVPIPEPPSAAGDG